MNSSEGNPPVIDPSDDPWDGVEPDEFDEGYEDAALGKAKSDNPYSSDCVEAAEWDSGWDSWQEYARRMPEQAAMDRDHMLGDGLT